MLLIWHPGMWCSALSRRPGRHVHVHCLTKSLAAGVHPERMPPGRHMCARSRQMAAPCQLCTAAPSQAAPLRSMLPHHNRRGRRSGTRSWRHRWSVQAADPTLNRHWQPLLGMPGMLPGLELAVAHILSLGSLAWHAPSTYAMPGLGVQVGGCERLWRPWTRVAST